MAKSKAGGTRTYLRGRVGSDVYSIGKDGKGKKQQVVRALAESVANPQTAAQMRQRMIMTTVSILAKGLRGFIDHSFDGIPTGQPCISEFTRLAIKAYEADVALVTPKFGYSVYGGKQICNAAVQISKGKVKGTAVVMAGNQNSYSNQYGAVGFDYGFPDKKAPHTGTYDPETWPKITYRELYQEMFGADHDCYLTFIQVNKNGSVRWFRLAPKTGVSLDSEVAADTLSKNMFDFETDDNSEITQGLSAAGSYLANDGYISGSVGIAADCEMIAWGVILSVKKAGQWKHSTSSLNLTKYDGSVADLIDGEEHPTAIAPYVNTADVAIATYPEGTEKFLNGGEL